MSGCVTVIGPPRAICSLNFGITLPLEPSTLPKRTAMKRVAWPCIASCDKAISAARLLAPITLLGLTALSVEISMKRSTLAALAWGRMRSSTRQQRRHLRQRHHLHPFGQRIAPSHRRDHIGPVDLQVLQCLPESFGGLGRG